MALRTELDSLATELTTAERKPIGFFLELAETPSGYDILVSSSGKSRTFSVAVRPSAEAEITIIEAEFAEFIDTTQTRWDTARG